MITLMILHDSLMLSFSVLVFAATSWFFYLTTVSLRKHKSDDITCQHFLEHSIAAAFVAIGSLFLIFSGVHHLFSSHQDGDIEYATTAPELLLRFGIICFLLHMIKEQTPGHPFYMREYADYEINEGQ